MTEEEVTTFIFNRLGPFCQTVANERPTLDSLRETLTADMPYPYDDMAIHMTEISARDNNDIMVTVTLRGPTGEIMNIVHQF
jgi:hypothetical protein